MPPYVPRHLLQPFSAKNLRLCSRRRHVPETAHLVAEAIPSAFWVSGHGEKEIQVKTVCQRQQKSGLMSDLLAGRVRVPETDRKPAVLSG